MAEPVTCGSTEPPAGPPILEARGLAVSAGERVILRNVDLAVAPRGLHAVIGPSGAGKSTLLRCLNRLVDLEPELTVTGEVRFQGRSVRDAGVDPDELRARVGMLFQQPVVFAGSIAKNVAFGARRLGLVRRGELEGLVEKALRDAALWDEVRDRLREPAATLSVGQKQRLCLARALAIRPEVLLMDEPTSALDPRATASIEELLSDLKRDRTIVLVTHDIAQARRTADWVSCLCVQEGAGELLESACCDQVLDHPSCQAVAEYLEHAAR